MRDTEDARKVQNGLIDKRPALIVRSRGAADVAAAIGLDPYAGLDNVFHPNHNNDPNG